MRSFFVHLWCGLLIFTLAGAAQAADAEALRQLFTGRYAALQSAITAHDNRATGAVLTPDFVYIDHRWRSLGAVEMIAEILPAFPLERKTSTIVLQSINLAGGAARIVQRTTTSIRLPAADRRGRSLLRVALSTDIWIKINGHWRLQRRETHSLNELIDGKPVK